MSNKKEERNNKIDRCIKWFANNIFEIIFWMVVITIGGVYFYIYYTDQINYKEKPAIAIAFLGGIIGGFATLMAVVSSTIENRNIQRKNLEETRRIQEENNEYNNKQINIILINDKIKEYKNVVNLLYSTAVLAIKIHRKCVKEKQKDSDQLRTLYLLNREEVDEIYEMFSQVKIDYLSIQNENIRTNIENLNELFVSITDKMEWDLTCNIPYNKYNEIIELVEYIEKCKCDLKSEINMLYKQKYELSKFDD